MIGYVWPEAESSAAGLRTWNWIRCFRQANWEIVFASASQENEFTEKLKQFGVITHPIQANQPAFDSWIRHLRPDFVLFDRFVTEEQFGWRVQENAPQAVRVLDTQDLHFLRRARESALKNGTSLDDLAACRFPLVTEDTLRELGAIYRSDWSLMISDFETQLLQQKFLIPKALLSTFRFQYPEQTPISPSYSDRENFVMIGNFRHPPNRDGILWFRKEIWPLIRKKISKAQVHIYGAYPPREMMQLSDPEHRFFVKGPCANQFETLMKYKVNLAPLRFGAGIKGKISDGWWAGTPVVATEIGSEGMAEDLPWGGAISNRPDEFADLAVELYQNECLWNVAQKNGYQILQRHYSTQKNSDIFLSRLIMLQSDLESRRQANLIGAILSHHTCRSTKYFSKWIEAKNQVPQSQ
jgi:glycosyltransferase involved in cell wall biosynthesis